MKLSLFRSRLYAMLHHVIAGACAAFLVVGMIVAPSSTACNVPAKTVANVAVRIADDVCKEVESLDAGPDWVSLACTAIDGTGAVVNVLMPRLQWAARKGPQCPDAGAPKPCASVQGGPGK